MKLKKVKNILGLRRDAENKSANPKWGAVGNGKMKKKSGKLLDVVKGVRSSKLKKEEIRSIIQGCSIKRNYLIEYLWIMSIKGNEIHGITALEGGFNKVRFSIEDIKFRLSKDGENEFIIIHNHPGGNPMPSEADFKFLSRLKDLETKTFKLRDFLIFSEEFIYSHAWNKDMPRGEVDPIFWSDAIERMRGGEIKLD